ncbi:MAG: hypothetical protein K8R59_00110 [Thermoanaerobaculales bacterium]|nr:hypothetical protein [Thermoanaerobaculales bacterium]
MKDGILKIDNRTENWKTAKLYHERLSNACVVDFASKIIRAADQEPGVIKREDISVELFWKGFRDLRYSSSRDKQTINEKVLSKYKRAFRGLRNDVMGFPGLSAPRKHNYGMDDGCLAALVSNLMNTEIDIVIQTPAHLLIGEAKHTQALGAESKNLLVHQLIRQYVMATVVAQISHHEWLKVVPFIVSTAPVRKRAQIRFMLRKGWLADGNLYGWDLKPL